MSVLLLAIICTVMVATSFLSGLFGMAGGLVLIGVLLFLLPLPAAMALHAITQIASNVWRAAIWWRHIRWPAAIAYSAGCLIVLLIWNFYQYVPSMALALLVLGIVPFIGKLIPQRYLPTPDRLSHCGLFGFIAMVLMLMTGVAGPVLDQFFLNGKLDRREIVATKGACQVFGHAVKLTYFGALIEQAGNIPLHVAILAIAASFAGTAWSKKFLEAMEEEQYRRWAGRIVTAIAGYYVIYGGYLTFVA
ncbi:MAG: permease [Rhodospirillaceae bacterium]|nr:permease [Rhodospirillaceae bacterium]|tara:strand:+ start:2006 stop:2749 length:744 start_codon:yes stop_codon:yes gene_type:complete